MAITPPTIFNALMNARAAGGFSFNGFAFELMAQGIASGVGLWAVGQSQNLALTGTAVGTAGSGALTAGILEIPPDVPGVLGALRSAGIEGQLASSLATVLSTAISSVFSTSGNYVGSSPSVGVGADVSFFSVSNPATLIPILLGSLGGTMGTGVAMPRMAVGFGNGIAQMLLKGTGTAIITGPPSLSPASGITNSVVV